MKLNIAKLVAAIVICEFAGIFGSLFTYSKIPTWYATLAKPEFAPPNWIFGPVWITLFALMGIALYVIWNKGLTDKKNKQAVMFFAAQLVLNALWSLLFFGLESPFYGFVGIAALWIAIVLTIWKFWKIDRNAAFLLLPYIAWVSFAAAVNYAVWILNP